MKLGIVADVHCNVEGLRRALDLMGPVDELLWAGDAVYQFRFSNEVMALLRERRARYILGNHERVLLGEWGEAARSQEGLRADLLAYMAEQPYQLETRVDGKRLEAVRIGGRYYTSVEALERFSEPVVASEEQPTVEASPRASAAAEELRRHGF